MKRMIIGFGGKRRRGKDLACELTKRLLADIDHVARIDHFAASIKDGIGKGVFGFSHDQLYGDLKTAVDPFWGITPRDVFQRFGTEVMHTQFGADIWVRTLLRRVENGTAGVHVLVGDVRFPHEVEALHRQGALLVKIDRDLPASEVPAEDAHASETALDDWHGWDYMINNNGTVEDLRRHLAEWLVSKLFAVGVHTQVDRVVGISRLRPT